MEKTNRHTDTHTGVMSVCISLLLQHRVFAVIHVFFGYMSRCTVRWKMGMKVFLTDKTIEKVGLKLVKMRRKM